MYQRNKYNKTCVKKVKEGRLKINNDYRHQYLYSKDRTYVSHAAILPNSLESATLITYALLATGHASACEQHEVFGTATGKELGSCKQYISAIQGLRVPYSRSGLKEMGTGLISTEELRLSQQNDCNNFQQNDKMTWELDLFQQ